MWKVIKLIEYYLGIIVFIVFCLLISFCLIMKFELMQIESLSYIDWDGSVNALSKAGIPIMLLSFAIQKRKKKNIEKSENAKLPCKEEILNKAKINAEKFKKKSKKAT